MFKDELDGCIEVFQQAGYDVHIFRSMEPGDIDERLSQAGPGEYDTIVIAGGDGSINIVVNSIMKYGLKSKLGVIPAGTANDFASFLKLPKSPIKAAQVIAAGNSKKTDVGEAGGCNYATQHARRGENGHSRFFINVCAAGLLTNVSQIVDPGFKNAFGKLAYYIKGLEQLPSLVPLPMRITTPKQVIEEDLYWFTILNTAGTGGFDRLSPEAAIDDGLFDFVGFRAMPLHELAILFVKMLASGDYLNDDNVIFIRESDFKIEYLGNDADMLSTDTDGERGPDMPVEVRNISKCLDIFYESKELVGGG